MEVGIPPTLLRALSEGIVGLVPAYTVGPSVRPESARVVGGWPGLEWNALLSSQGEEVKADLDNSGLVVKTEVSSVKAVML